MSLFTALAGCATTKKPPVAIKDPPASQQPGTPPGGTTPPVTRDPAPDPVPPRPPSTEPPRAAPVDVPVTLTVKPASGEPSQVPVDLVFNAKLPPPSSVAIDLAITPPKAVPATTVPLDVKVTGSAGEVALPVVLQGRSSNEESVLPVQLKVSNVLPAAPTGTEIPITLKVVLAPDSVTGGTVTTAHSTVCSCSVCSSSSSSPSPPRAGGKPGGAGEPSTPQERQIARENNPWTPLLYGAIVVVAAAFLGGATRMVDPLRTRFSEVAITPPSGATTEPIVRTNWLYECLSSLVAAMLVPVFLHFVGSDLLASAVREPLNLLTVGGLCLLGALTAPTFVPLMTRHFGTKTAAISETPKAAPPSASTDSSS